MKVPLPHRLLVCGLTALNGKRIYPSGCKWCCASWLQGMQTFPGLFSLGAPLKPHRPLLEHCSYHCDVRIHSKLWPNPRSMRINSYSKLGGGKHNIFQWEKKYYSSVENRSSMRNTFDHLYKKVKRTKRKKKKVVEGRGSETQLNSWENRDYNARRKSELLCQPLE